ncbi:MAG: ParB/RepB/Spo0J family partition protein [Clostridiales bacterium]|nr:ParB/RepB/Spo0J family partition protein [Clostridiales bacterium]
MEKINDIVMLNINMIVPNPYQPRQKFDDKSLSDLADSIKHYGILQPITVRKNEDVFELIMGERRFRAAQLVNLKKIPAIILEVDNNDSAVVALIENLQRVDLTFIEEAESYKKLIEFHGITQNDLSEKIGKSQSTISNKLRILKLEDHILDTFKQSNLTERHARSLLRLGDVKEQEKVLNKVLDKCLNVKETEKLVESKLNHYKKKNQNSTFKVNYRIYHNTIKKAFKLVQDLSTDSSMTTSELEDCLEITIRIPKDEF